MRDFTKYEVWQLGMELVTNIYKISSGFPDEERYGLTSQIRRSCISIPSNVAEGCSRSSERDFKRYIEISFGSCFELKTQLLISGQLNFLSKEETEKSIATLDILARKLISLRNKLQKSNG